MSVCCGMEIPEGPGHEFGLQEENSVERGN